MEKIFAGIIISAVIVLASCGKNNAVEPVIPPVSTSTSTVTRTKTAVYSPTITRTRTPVQSLTITPTRTLTATVSLTYTGTITKTATSTPTATVTKNIEFGMYWQKHVNYYGDTDNTLSTLIKIDGTPCVAATVSYDCLADATPAYYVPHISASPGLYRASTELGDPVPEFPANSILTGYANVDGMNLTVSGLCPVVPTVTNNGLNIHFSATPTTRNILVVDKTNYVVFSEYFTANPYLIDPSVFPGPALYDVYIISNNSSAGYGGKSVTVDYRMGYEIYPPSRTSTPTATRTCTPTVTYTSTPDSSTFRQGASAYTGNTDTTLSSQNTTFNYGSCPEVGAGSTAGETGRSIIKFNVSALSGSTVSSATLTLYQNALISGSGSLVLYGLSSAFVEGAACGSASAGTASWVSSGTGNWTSAGGDYGTAVSNTRTFNTSTASVTFTLNASAVQSWVDNPSENYGMLLKTVTETAGNYIYFGSSENTTSTLRPLLTVNYY